MTQRLYSPARVRALMDKYGFTFSKRFGQNFLIDGNIIRKIVQSAGVDSETGVIEIGPGFGTLTEELALKAKRVVAIEIDARLIPVLTETTQPYGNVVILEADAMKVDLDQVCKMLADCRKVQVVANLPYYITTPVLTRLIDEAPQIQALTVMVQKEVADRMVAGPGTKDYGSLSLFIQYHTHPNLAIKAPKSVFMPQPKVDSAVVHMDRKVNDFPHEDLMFALIRSAFNQRRKTLPNALQAALPAMSKEDIRAVLEALSIDPRSRAENLTIPDFQEIAKKIAQDV